MGAPLIQFERREGKIVIESEQCHQERERAVHIKHTVCFVYSAAAANDLIVANCVQTCAPH